NVQGQAGAQARCGPAALCAASAGDGCPAAPFRLVPDLVNRPLPGKRSPAIQSAHLKVRSQSGGRPMRFLFGAITAIFTLGLALAALAQSPPANPTPPPVQTNDAPAAPVAASKLFACQTAVKGLQGQERQDQMQLCRAQAHLDCL